MAFPKRLNKMQPAFLRTHISIAAKAKAEQRTGRVRKASAYQVALSYAYKQSFQHDALQHLQESLERLTVEYRQLASAVAPALLEEHSARVSTINSLQPYLDKIKAAADKQGVHYQVVDLASVLADAPIDQKFTDDTEVCFLLLMPENFDLADVACFQETVGGIIDSEVRAFDALHINADVVMRSKPLRNKVEKLKPQHQTPNEVRKMELLLS